MPPRLRESKSLRPLEPPLVGAWIACTLIYWVASGVHDKNPSAAELDLALRLRLALGEAGLAFFVILLSLRRRAHGLQLFLPFVAAALTAVAALWLAPDLSKFESSPASRGSAAPGGDAPLLLHLLGGADALKIIALFTLLVLEIPWRGRRA